MLKNKELLENVSYIECPNCKVKITSVHRHDFRPCPCFINEVNNTGVAIDGGRDYTKISFTGTAPEIRTGDFIYDKVTGSVQFLRDNTEVKND